MYEVILHLMRQLWTTTALPNLHRESGSGKPTAFDVLHRCDPHQLLLAHSTRTSITCTLQSRHLHWSGYDVQLIRWLV